MTAERRAINIRLCGVTEPDFDRYRGRFVGQVWPDLLRLEGGYVNSSTDAGGPTARGGVTYTTVMELWARHREWCEVWKIPYVAMGSSREAAEPAMKLLVPEQAQGIALVFYYIRPGIARLPVPWDRAVLDWRYNGGPAIDRLQLVACVARDSVIGTKKTVPAVEALNKLDLEMYFEYRLSYLKSLKGSQGWEANGRGWTRRLEQVKAACLREWPAGI